MGQGTDSCGGYDVDYDPYDEGLAKGEWTTRTNGTIHVSKMSVRHLTGARIVAQRAAHNATFSDQREKWEEWVELFDRELSHREYAAPPAKPVVVKAPQPVRGTMVVMICHCKTEYEAREADLKRGYGFSCSKRCAAIRREYKRPKAKRKQ